LEVEVKVGQGSIIVRLQEDEKSIERHQEVIL
jgi:hypothetical protein